MSQASQLVIIGGSDAGISAALRAREVASEWKVTMVVADAYPNFSICGLPYFLSGEVPDWRSLAHRTREEIEGAGIHLLMDTSATAIAPQERTVSLRYARGGATSLSYDRLVIATGATPRRPAIRGLDVLLPRPPDEHEPVPRLGEPGVYLLHSMEQSFALHRQLERHPPRRAVIVGGGYISLEMAEALTSRGIPTTILQRRAHLHPSVDPAFGARLAELLTQHGVEVETGVDVSDIEPAHDPHADGYALAVHGRATMPPRSAGRADQAAHAPGERVSRRWPADLVLVATGVEPAISITQGTGVQLGMAGAIRVTRAMETSEPDIFAAGDCVETHHRLLSRPTYLPLGTTAHKQGRIAGENAVGGQQQFAGTVGTQAVRVFEAVVTRTGLLEAEARNAGYDPLTIELTTWDHKVYYPGAHELVVRLTGDRQTRQLLGVQLLGRWGDEVSKRIDIVAAALYAGLPVDQLNELDLSYTPPLSSPWDPVQMAAQQWQAELTRLKRPASVQAHDSVVVPGSKPERETQMTDETNTRPVQVLFLCTHNSARSQMAEGILRHLAGGQIEVASAGTAPTSVNLLAVRALAELGIDISGQRSKHLDEFLGQRFDFVITLCDQAAETCPVFPGDPERIHWSFPDPAAVTGDEDVRYQAFRQVAMQLMTRLRVTLPVLLQGRTRS